MPMRDPATGRFSVIIPTLQRSDDLDALVRQCAEHEDVLEVLVINNAPSPLSWPSPKVRVLQQEENIFVNPAWNLGAATAQGEYLAIVNDDVLFSDDVFPYAARLLADGHVGLVGPSPRVFGRFAGGRIRHRQASDYSLRRGFGTCMMLRREDYVPIPESIKVWGGDSWLLLVQKYPSAELLGTRFRTEMSTTAGSPEFQAFRRQEAEESFRILAALVGTRQWHAAAGRLARRHALEAKVVGKASRAVDLIGRLRHGRGCSSVTR